MEKNQKKLLKYQDIELESEKELSNKSELSFSYESVDKSLEKDLKIRLHDLIYFCDAKIENNKSKKQLSDNKYKLTMPLDIPYKKYKVARIVEKKDADGNFKGYEIKKVLDAKYSDKKLSFETDELGKFAVYVKSPNAVRASILMLGASILAVFGLSYATIPEFKDNVDTFFNDTFNLDTPSAPVIDGGSDKWVKSATIKVVKDAKVGGTGKLDHYVYCINDTTNSKKCSWFRTDTKNVVVAKQGIHYVWFKGVNEKGVAGAISNMEKVMIDAEAPTIKELEYGEITENKINIRVNIKDAKSCYYQVNDGALTKFNCKDITLENLEADTEYTIKIKSIDENENESESEITIKTAPKNNDDSPKGSSKGSDKDSDDGKIKDEIEYELDIPNDKWAVEKFVTIKYPKNCKKKEFSLDNKDTWIEYKKAVLFGNVGNIIARCSNDVDTKEAPKFEVKMIDPKIPELSLDNIPLKFMYGEFYNLPTSYKFGISGGTVRCTASGVQYKDTSTIPPGKHKLTCTAISGAGAKTTKSIDIEVEGIGDWLNLKLDYPKNSLNRQWMLTNSNVAVTYSDYYYQWSDYVGPIRVRVEDAKNIIIKYDMDGETVYESPAGYPIVVIEPDDYVLDEGKTTTVKIVYDKDAVVKQYKINGMGWKDYTGPFTVGPNTAIEARVAVNVDVYDDNGDVVAQKKVPNNTSVVISKTPGWEASIKINCPKDLDFGVTDTCTIDFEGEFDSKEYHVNGNNNSYANYTGPINVKAGDLVTARGTKMIGGKVEERSATFYVNESENNSIVIKCPGSLKVGEIGTCTIDFSSNFDSKEYHINGNSSSFTTYQGSSFSVVAGDVITARGTRNRNGNPQTVTKVAKVEVQKGNISITANPEIPAKGTKATITVQYDEMMSIRQYRVHELDDVTTPEWKDYEGPFTAGPGAVIEARGQIPTLDMVKVTKILSQDPYFLTMSASNYTPKVGETSTVTINYSPIMTTKKYRVDGGAWKDYTEPFTVLPNSIVDAWGAAPEYSDMFETIKIGEEVYVPSNVIPGPTITFSEVAGDFRFRTTTITTPRPAKKIYYSIGRDFKLYDGPFVVRKGTTVTAYYIDEETSKQSLTSSKSEEPINEGSDNGQAPRVFIYANPDRYATKKASKVTVTIAAGGAQTIEYSLDGVIWVDYTKPLEIYQNCTVYARATNKYGQGGDYYVIDHINDNAPKVVTDVVDIIIKSSPYQNRQTLQNYEQVTIAYDPKATTKFYRIGSGGMWQSYTGPFTVDKNTTIYAYQETPNGTSDAKYKIDAFSIGYADPVINVANNGSYKKITINYDKNAVKNTYSIDGREFEDYEKAFNLDENCVIYARSEFEDGTVTTSMEYITNINNSSAGRIRIQNEQDYIKIDLTYPDSAAKNTRRYKFKENGIMTDYKDAGIILIKQNKVNDVIDADGNAYIKDNGQKVKFKGDYYILDVDISQIWDNIFMTWEDGNTDVPEIIFDNDGTDVSPSTWASKVKATIFYPSTLRIKEYRVLDPDGNDTGWIDYEEPFEITKNGTIVYARGYSSAKIVSQEVSRVATKIDNGNPSLRVINVVDKTMDSLTLQFIAEDSEGHMDKYLYSMDGENWIEANTTSYKFENLRPNTSYTLYAKAIDEFGNESDIFHLVDKTENLTAPIYKVTPNDNEWSTQKQVEITYIDGNYDKEYSLDLGKTWKVYTAPLTITKPTSIIARVKDSDGNVAYGSTLTLNRIDTTAPVINKVTTIAKSSRITISVDSEDNESGVLKYYYSVDGVNFETSYTNVHSITGLTKDTDYTVYVKTENLTGLISNVTTTNEHTSNIDEPNYPIVKSFDDQKRRFYTNASGDRFLVNDKDEVFDLNNSQKFNVETGEPLHINDDIYVPEFKYADGSVKAQESDTDTDTQVDDVWAYSKEITIYYPYFDEDCSNQYAIIDKKNPNAPIEWKNYIGPVTVDKEDVALISRVISGPNDVRATSTINLELIDRTEPTIDVTIQPLSIAVGDSHPLPTNYAGDNNKSGASAKCWVGDDEQNSQITNTSQLRSGKNIVHCKVTTGAGHSVTIEHKQPVYPSLTFNVNSILQGIQTNNLEDGDFYFVVNNGNESVTYTVELYNFGDTVLSDIYEKDEYGNDVYDKNGNKIPKRFCDDIADEKMCILNFNGNLTIDPGVVLTPQVRKKGFTVLVNGTLTNNGTISNSGMGLPGVSENVYLWKNSDGSYEYVPAVGGSGAEEAVQENTGYKNGNIGLPAAKRATGGGGSGGSVMNGNYKAISGAGGTGTSYSGGSGGGPAVGTCNVIGNAGSNDAQDGGTGSKCGNMKYGIGGGAGNPTAESTPLTPTAKNGAGGLLNIYASILDNNGTIESNGIDAPNITGKNEANSLYAAGGGSGGGSINIFYNSIANKGTIEAKGGKGGVASNATITANGGAGADGRVTLSQISGTELLGSSTKHYDISSVDEFINAIEYAQDYSGATFNLTSDLDLSGYTISPIGNFEHPFSGKFIGNNHIISNVKIESDGDNVGLFGLVTDATISDLKILNADITGNDNVGIIAGSVYDGTIINNVEVTGAVHGNNNVGGAAGFVANTLNETSITNVVTDVTIDCNDNIGGLIGKLYSIREGSAVVTNNGAKANIIATGNNIGGLIGNVDATTTESITISSSYSEGSAKGNNYVGGLIGKINTSNVNVISIDKVQADTDIEGYNYIGGLIGYAEKIDLKNAYSLGNLKGNDYAGSFIGYVENSTIENTYAIGEVDTTLVKHVGGYAGVAKDTTATNAYFSSQTTKVIKTALGINLRIQRLIDKISYNNFDFTSTWAIDNGNTTAYLSGLPLPLRAYRGNINYNILTGSGTATNPYLIYNVDDLREINNELGAYYKLMSDIDLTGIDFDPIGQEYVTFTGVFDGNNHKITNLNVDKEKLKVDDNVGLFEVIENATIKDLTIQNASISGDNNAGILAGKVLKSATINNVKVEGNIDVENAKELELIIIPDQVTKANDLANKLHQVTGVEVNDVLKYLNGTKAQPITSLTSTEATQIRNENFAGVYIIEGRVGGLVGALDLYDGHSTLIDNIITNTTINADGERVGGLVGDIIIRDSANYPLQIQNINASSEITSTNDNVGGVIGLLTNYSNQSVTIDSIETSGSLSGKNNVGGLAGKIITSKAGATTITNVVNETLVTATGDNVGGSIGYFQNSKTAINTIDNIVNKQSVTGASNVGGVIGSLQNADNGENIVTNINSQGETIKGTSQVGGVIGLLHAQTYDGSTGQNKVSLLYSESEVIATGDEVGGLIGKVQADSQKTPSANIVEKAYATGKVTGNTRVGGFVGFAMYSEFNDTFSTGEVNATNIVGSYVGEINQTNINRSYAIGRINTTGGVVGGFVSKAAGSILTDSYFSSQTTGYIKTSAGLNNKIYKLLKQTTYNNYDFANTWSITPEQTTAYLKGLPKPTSVDESSLTYNKMTGNGTQSDPYVIRTNDDLNDVRHEASAYYVLANDLDLEGYLVGGIKPMEPIGEESAAFSGTFDGQGHTIKNYTYTSTENDVGLFSLTNNATIKNLVLENINVTGKHNVGTLVGSALDGIELDNITITGSSVTANNSGTEALILRKNLIKNNTDAAKIISRYAGVNYSDILDYLNGITSIQPLKTITPAQANNIDKEKIDGVSTISGNVGGLVGRLDIYNSQKASIKNIETDIEMTVSGERIGGIVGDILMESPLTSDVEFNNVKATTNITGAKENVGGIVGLVTNNSVQKFDLTSIETKGKLTGTNYVGGSVGKIDNKSTGAVNLYTITNESSMENDATAKYVGGIVGQLLSNTDAAISAQVLTNKSDITATECSAGIIGCASTSGTILNFKNLENEGNIVGKNNTAGIIGKLENVGTSLVDALDLHNKGNVTGEQNVGGLLGTYLNQTTGKLTLASSSSIDGIIKGTLNVGGLIGLAYNNATGEININTSYSKDAVENTGAYTGGLIGQLYSNSTGTIKLEKTYTTGNVTSNGNYAGGLVGSVKNATTKKAEISQSYTSGYLKGVSYAGGLIGQVENVNLENVFSTSGYENITKDLAKPTEADYIGGLIGYGYNSSINKAYAMGNLKVNGNMISGVGNYKNFSTKYNTGGIIGLSDKTIVTDTYFTGQASGIIRGTNGTIKPILEMFNQDTYNYDFANIWGIEEDETTPYLQVLEKPDNIEKSNYPIYNLQGEGTASEPYLIYNLEDLNHMRFDLDKNYKLMNDIDLTIDENGTKFPAIGEEQQPFTGVFDGNDHVIYNGTIDTFDDSIGLFGAVRGATIENLTLRNITYFKNENVGSLVGTAFDGVTIDNVKVENVISLDGTNVGGLVGYLEQINSIDSTIRNITIDTDLTGKNSGGLIGYINNNSVDKLNITDVEIKSTIDGTQNVGGLIGYNKSRADNEITINDITISGNIKNDITESTTHNLGGLIGLNEYHSSAKLIIDDIEINGTIAINDITAVTTDKKKPISITTTSNVGGLIGYNNVLENASETKITNSVISGTINLQNTMSDEDINVTQNLGGFIGKSYLNDQTNDGLNKATLEISSSYVSADVTSLKPTTDKNIVDGTTGGFIGLNESNSLGEFKLHQVYVTSNITGNNNVGGLIGKNTQNEMGKNKVELTYTTGKVTGNNYVGGIVGQEIGNVFADVEVNKSYSTGKVTGNDNVGGLIGQITNANTNDTYTTSEVEGNTNVASYIGSATNASLKNSYGVGKVTSTGTTISGFVSTATSSVSNNSYFSSDSTKKFRTAIGANVRIYNLVNAVDVYDNWNFTDTWAIDLGNSLAYLKDLPIPESVDASNYNVTRYDGNGMIGSEYEIYTPDDLSNMRVETSAHYKLMNDIDMTGYDFYPIGEDNQVFTGTLDGQGYTIRNLNVNDTGLLYNGLFGVVEDATIRNLNIENMTITSTGEKDTGSLIGQSKGTLVVDNVSVNNSNITAQSANTGGLIGSSVGNTKITNVSVNAEIDSNGTNTGGLIGVLNDKQKDETIIMNINMRGTIASSGNVGGILGSINNTLESEEEINISNSSINVNITGKVQKDLNIGGVIGYAKDDNPEKDKTEIVIEGINTLLGTISVKDNISGRININAGGIVGYSYISDGKLTIQNIIDNIKIDNEYTIANNSDAKLTSGGVIGNNTLYGDGEVTIDNVPVKNTITDISTIGDATRNTYTGGVIGLSENELNGKVAIKNLYVSGDIKATSNVGGIVGYIYDKLSDSNVPSTKIENVYTHHNIEAEGSFVGGLVGSFTSIDVGEGSISKAYSSGSIKAKGSYVGGILGQAAYLDIADVYSTSKVEGKDYTSSFVAASGYSSYDNVYAIGEILSPGKTVGSIVAHTADDTFTNAYYSSEATNLPLSKAGINVAFSKLLKQTTYSGYDFTNIWTIDENSSTAYLQGMPDPTTDNTLYNYANLQGKGTISEPYLIHDYTELRSIAIDLGAVYSIENDIEAPENSRFVPFGNKEAPFTGTILGNGHKLSNITIESNQDDASIFGYIANASITNLKLDNINVTADRYAATIAGRAEGNVTITDIEVSGSVVGTGDNIGGVVANITNSDNNKITLKNITNNLDIVQGNDYVGGIVSQIDNSITGEIEIANITSKSDIKGSYNTGGIVGYLFNPGLGRATLTNIYSYNTIKVMGITLFDDVENAGGIAGAIKGSLSAPVEITNSYSDAKVDGDTNVGGLVGSAEMASITNSASTGEFGGELNSGGLIGKADNCNVNATYSYAIQTDYQKNYGSLIGKADNSSITNSYYSSEINEEQSNNGIDLAITDTLHSANYNGFDFDNVWNIDEGTSVPYLKGTNATYNQNTVPETATTQEFESILAGISANRIRTGLYHFLVNGKDYEIHTYVFDGDQHWTQNMTFGNRTDIATNERDAKRMVVVKVKGNLTIDPGVTVEPFYSQYGGPKGFTLYVTGDLTNNGTIDNSHGAKAEGEDVYLWKNANGTYEYIPAEGAKGGAGTTAGISDMYYGNIGDNGTDRKTAGGGSGQSHYGTSGSGGTGTSYSGGTGGAGGGLFGAYGACAGGSGSSTGGTGGIGARCGTRSSGGTGNPGGSPDGQNGTGGLLVIYSTNLTNGIDASITANGTDGGTTWTYGGASGGGSINIFYRGNLTIEDQTKVTANGGQSQGNGHGGNGSITYTEMTGINVYATPIYPKLEVSDFKESQMSVELQKDSTVEKIKYSLDDGTTWINYEEPFEISIGDTVKYVGQLKSGSTTREHTYTSEITGDLNILARDDILETTYEMPANTVERFDIDTALINKTLFVYTDGELAVDAKITFYNENNEVLKEYSIDSDYNKYPIPNNIEYAIISSGNKVLNIREVVNRKTYINDKLPNISINQVGWAVSKNVTIDYPTGEGYVYEYSIDNAETWQPYTGTITLNENTTVYARVTKNGKHISSESFTVSKISSDLIESDGIIFGLKNTTLENGIYKFAANGEVYPVHYYSIDGDQIWDSEMVFGDENDVGTANSYAKNMVVVKVNGDLTITENGSVRPYYTQYGGPKGFVLYVTGTLTNNGTIDNSHGAYAEGQDVYLWKNSDGSYEVVPAKGASGGESVEAPATSGTVGKSGANGENRQTGGGGSGTAWYDKSVSGAGGSGTSYSGGAGGSGVARTAGNYIGIAGSSVGGPGGRGIHTNVNGAGGGAGNPGASGSGYGTKGENGTGGLLVIYANSFINNGTIKANGSLGGTGDGGRGGSSGGGSINIFYENNYSYTGRIEAKGATPSDGGAGGNGSVNIGKIINGSYVATSSKVINGDSILRILQSESLDNGVYSFKVNNATYKVHYYTFDGDQTWNSEMVFGNENDVGTVKGYAENMVVVKVNGNLTITETGSVRPYYSEYGGPKGFTLYVTGKLTNNGTIDNSHGAYAKGQDVYLWKNADGTYEVIPAEGATGGTGNYASGNNGTGRQTGGGATGNRNSGAGGTGTSYSGGAGGAGEYYNCCGTNGSSEGGSGGIGTTNGAGNPGGNNGTGGLLIIYANEYENNGRLTAIGADGTSGWNDVTGGPSGGGSINIFTNQSTGMNQSGINTDVKYAEILGSYNVNGGNPVRSGTGGIGTINIGQIRNGQYYDLKQCIDQDKEAFVNN